MQPLEWFFKGGSTTQKKNALDNQIAEKLKEALKEEGSEKPDFKKVDQLRADAMKISGDRAALDKFSGTNFKSDSLAAVGGFIGGAAAGIDPSLQVQQDTLNVQRQILVKAGATVDMLKALKDAANIPTR